MQPLDGEMDKTTQNRSEYGRHGVVPRAELARPSTTNKAEGIFLISILSTINIHIVDYKYFMFIACKSFTYG